jgi:hypothetical protein
MRSALQGAGELEREERIAAGCLDQTYEERPRESHSEPLVKKPMQRAQRKGTDAYRSEPFARQHAVEVEWSCARVGGTLRDKQRHALVREAARSEPEDAFACCVEPLDVIDGNKDRSRSGEHTHCAEDCNGHCAGLGRLPLRE